MITWDRLRELHYFIREVGLASYTRRSAIRQFYKRIARAEHSLQLPTGGVITLPVASEFATKAYLTGAEVDWGSDSLLYKLLTGRGAFLDIGANIGYYSAYMLPKATAVYSFEPDPRARKHLVTNVGGDPRVHIIPAAVGQVGGRALFTLEAASELSHLSRETDASNKIEVDVTTVDEFVAANSISVEAIKIDAEGYDYEIVEGALNTLVTQSPLVLTEARPDQWLFETASRVSYRVFGYVREPRRRLKSFKELFCHAAFVGDTKMLFLVPAYVSEYIRRLA